MQSILSVFTLINYVLQDMVQDRVARWLSGRALDLRSRSREFEARPRPTLLRNNLRQVVRRPCSDFMDMLRRLISCRIIIIIIITASNTKQYNLVPAKAGK